MDFASDITAPDIAHGAYDLIVCNQVSEHVDDRAALRELRRVLAPGGRALITVPVVEGWAETCEDDGILDPAARRPHLDQSAHRRLYGRDVRARIAAEGFDPGEFTSDGAAGARHSIIWGSRVFLAARSD